MKRWKWPKHVMHGASNPDLDDGSKIQGFYTINRPDDKPDKPVKPPPPEGEYIFYYAQCSITDITNGVEWDEMSSSFYVPEGVTEFSFTECTTYHVDAYFDGDTWHFEYEPID